MAAGATLDTAGESVAFGSAVVTVVAALLPWISRGTATASGIDADGVLSLIFGLLAIAVVVFREWEYRDRIALGVFGVLTALVAITTFILLRNASGPMEYRAEIGLLVTLLGGIGMAAGAVVDWVLLATRDRPPA